jgi:hypothetical protein
MLNISSTQPVIWPSAPASGVTPVTAVTAVTPVQSSARDAQTGLGQGRDQPVPVSLRRGGAQPAEARRDPNTPEAAPLLPRESPDSPDGQASPEAIEAKAEAQAEEKALKRQLQDVLSDVWKASAAVVDVVLGRDAAAADAAGPGTTSAGDSTRSTAVPAANDAVQDPAVARLPQDVMAYDAQGNSSWAPLEAGSLLSRRV